MQTAVSAEPFIETPWEGSEPTIHSNVDTFFYDQPENFGYKEMDVDIKEVWENPYASKPSEKYRLQIGDQLFISLYGAEDVETARTVTVEPTGNITYLFVNGVRALGRTIDELRKDLETKIQEMYPNALVAMSATQITGNRYTIIGEINEPGTKQIAGNMTVLKAIGQAGGFPINDFRGKIVDFADLDHAFLARNGEYLPIDFTKLVKKGKLEEDVSLENGDYIYIPSVMAKEIYVLGEVAARSVYPYLHTATLAEVLAWSGGLTERAGSRIVVIRGSLNCPKSFFIDYCRMKRGCCPDFVLKPGDIVYVPCQKFWTVKQILKEALRTFVGAVAITAGVRAFESIEPAARDSAQDSIIINPATSFQATPNVVTP